MKTKAKKKPDKVGAKKKDWLFDEYREEILTMARSGNTNKDICAMLDISEDTFYTYCKKHPEFSETIKRAKIKSDTQIENALRKRALGYDYVEEQIEYTPAESSGKVKRTKVKTVKRVKKHIPGDVAAQFIWLKNRTSRWKDKQETEITQNKPLDIKITYV